MYEWEERETGVCTASLSLSIFLPHRIERGATIRFPTSVLNSNCNIISAEKKCGKSIQECSQASHKIVGATTDEADTFWRYFSSSPKYRKKARKRKRAISSHLHPLSRKRPKEN